MNLDIKNTLTMRVLEGLPGNYNVKHKELLWLLQADRPEYLTENFEDFKKALAENLREKPLPKEIRVLLSLANIFSKDELNFFKIF